MKKLVLVAASRIVRPVSQLSADGLRLETTMSNGGQAAQPAIVRAVGGKARKRVCDLGLVISLWFRHHLKQYLVVLSRRRFEMTLRSPSWTRLKIPRAVALAVLPLILLGSSCSVKKVVSNKLADSLASQSASSFATDDDPELIGDALPFALKLMEGTLEQVPNHRALLFATASGFTQYSYVWVQEPADEMEQQDTGRAQTMRLRARKLYLRARNYGIRGLEVKHPGFGTALRQNPKSTVAQAGKNDVPLLFWTAASWGAAISVSKDNPDLVADQPIVEALIDRSLQLDPDFDHGAIHGFLISYESARQGVKGDFASRSRQHFERQVELTGGQLASPYIALAETVSISKQDRSEFEKLLKQALAIDPDSRPEWRLNNTVMQRRARWLLSREDELFLDAAPEGASK